MRSYNYSVLKEKANFLTQYNPINNPDRPHGLRNKDEESYLDYLTIKGIWDRFRNGTMSKKGERDYILCVQEKRYKKLLMKKI